MTSTIDLLEPDIPAAVGLLDHQHLAQRAHRRRRNRRAGMAGIVCIVLLLGGQVLTSRTDGDDRSGTISTDVDMAGRDGNRTQVWPEPVETGGLSVGDPVGKAPLESGDHVFVPVCDKRSGCDRIVGFAHPHDITPELAPLDDPRNSELGYQPGPMPLVDEHGYLTGYLVPDFGFMTPDEVESLDG